MQVAEVRTPLRRGRVRTVVDEVVVLQYRPRRAGRVRDDRCAVEVAAKVHFAEVRVSSAGAGVVVAVGNAVHHLRAGVVDDDATCLAIARIAASYRAVHHRDRAVEIDTAVVAAIAVVVPVVLEEAAVDDAARSVETHAVACLRAAPGAPVGPAVHHVAALKPATRHPDVAAVAVACGRGGAAVFDDAIHDAARCHPDVAALAAVRLVAEVRDRQARHQGLVVRKREGALADNAVVDDDAVTARTDYGNRLVEDQARLVIGAGGKADDRTPAVQVNCRGGLLDRIGNGGEGMLLAAIVIIATGRRHIVGRTETGRQLERRRRRKGKRCGHIRNARRQISRPLDEPLPCVRRCRQGNRGIDREPGGAGRRDRAANTSRDRALDRTHRPLPHKATVFSRRWMCVCEGLSVAAVDDVAVVVVELPADAGIL